MILNINFPPTSNKTNYQGLQSWQKKKILLVLLVTRFQVAKMCVTEKCREVYIHPNTRK